MTGNRQWANLFGMDVPCTLAGGFVARHCNRRMDTGGRRRVGFGDALRLGR
ncbi:hypothetical protein ACFWAY_52045 [Rhodococcus sp. NPDC059968]|uniref:hypothetical protein n=1 Tax=Rhodococcus sp. NPDC059968 TaxID=3347017 RepID=UPI00366E5924